MMNWSPLDQSRFNAPETKISEGGINTLTLRSPFDVPEAIRAYRKKDTQELIIDLKYLGEEETKSINASTTGQTKTEATVDIGVNSGRVYQLHINNFEPSSTPTIIEAIMRRLTEFAGNDQRKQERYMVTCDILRAKDILKTILDGFMSSVR